MIEKSGVHTDHIARDIKHTGGDPIRSKPVNEPPVPLLPEEAAKPLGRADKQEVIKLIKLPFIEHEFVEKLMLLGECRGHGRTANIKQPGQGQSRNHHGGR